MWGHKKFNPAVMKGKKILDIGCGRKRLVGAVGLDRRSFLGVDIVADFNQPLPIDDDSYDVVHADQVLEHAVDLVSLLHEIHRILRPSGLLIAHVPYFRAAWAHIDPTHCRCFTLSTLDYFVRDTDCHKNYSFSARSFSKKAVYLDTDYRSTPLRGMFSRLAIRWPYIFENSILSFIFPFEQLTFVLTK